VSHSPGAAAGAIAATTAAAVAAQAERSRREEEDMSPGLVANPDWEFKILRSHTAMFRREERLRSVLAQESRAGWDLAEKMDDHRLRLRRHVRHRSQDAALDFDAYRTWVGISTGRIVALVLLAAFGAMGAMVILVLAAVLLRVA
jgi:hypothetical protein